MLDGPDDAHVHPKRSRGLTAASPHVASLLSERRPTPAMYNPEKCITIPRDSRLGLACLWLSSLILILHDAFDNDHNIGLEGEVGIFLALVACTWTCAVLHAYSRRVILEVMSYEHRQQMGPQQVTPPLQAVPE